MIPGNQYRYLFMSHGLHAHVNDIILDYEQYETTGIFIGMTHETNYCIFVSEYGNTHRVHYIVKEAVCGMSNSSEMNNLNSLQIYQYMQSREPAGYGYYTPVLFIQRANFSRPSAKESWKKDDDLETHKDNYCDMV